MRTSIVTYQDMPWRRTGAGWSRQLMGTRRRVEIALTIVAFAVLLIDVLGVAHVI